MATFTGTDGADVIDGTSGDDTADGGFGADTLNGNEGNDTFVFSAVVTTTQTLPVGAINGGSGMDTVDASRVSPTRLFGWTADALELRVGSQFFNVRDVEQFLFGSGDDYISLLYWSVDLTIRTGAGRDRIESGNGADVFYAGADDDFLSGGIGDRLYGEAGDDRLQLSGAFGVPEGHGIVDGGDGRDVLWTNISFVVDLTVGEMSAGSAHWVVSGIEDIETVVAFGYAATVVGDGADNHFSALNPIADSMSGGVFFDGRGGDDVLAGHLASDILVGGAGNDILNGGGHDAAAPDYFFGGTGNDTYYVNSAMTGAQDLVDEGEGNAALAGGAGDVDTIISQGALFWDFYSVAEILQIDRDAGGQIVGGRNVMNKTITGDIGNDVILTYGRSSTVDGGAGTDAISFELYGLAESYEGSNTLVMKPGNGMDYLYGFESGEDQIDLSGFGYGLSGAQWQSFLVDVENGANDYCFLYLGQADQYLVFVGVTSSQIQAGDFLS